jgi:deoxycytidine triphosphate deaminase
MTILADYHLEELMRRGLIIDPDYTLLNPASIDIRIGDAAIVETVFGRFDKVIIPHSGLVLDPGDFALVNTYEWFDVPNGYAMDLRLKSSTARSGFDHSLAFWVDPGWQGVLTMEIKNTLQYNALTIKPGQRFAQVIVHELSGHSLKPYDGRYKGARTVEGPKAAKS